jgi:signal transduction histidine kinase
MPTNPWVAADASALRTPELRRLWDEYFGGGRLEQVRRPIADSWHRSEIAGLDPSRSRASTLFEDRRDVGELWATHPLQVAAPLIRRWLGPVAEGREQVIVVSDAEGLLLWLDGDVRVRSMAADTMNFVEGSLWSEVSAGTNAIGTALAADHPVQVHAAEHFSEVVHGWTCSAAPVHDPEDGRLLGIIDLTGFAADAHSGQVGAALAAARAVEADLRVRVQQKDARLRLRYLESIASASGQLALVSRSGRVISDKPDGFIRAERIVVPAGGGVVALPGGQAGLAEPLGREDGYLVYPLHGRRLSRRRLEPLPTRGTDKVADAPALIEWRRAQFELSRIAEEQAALRRVATLVAGQVTPDEIFATVAEEVARLLVADCGIIYRYELNEMMTVKAFWTSKDGGLTVGARVGLEGEKVAALVLQSGHPSRLDTHESRADMVVEPADVLGGAPGSTVGAPILADGRVWGVVIAASTGAPRLADNVESRLMGFAELIATAISNAVTHAELTASRARIITAADESRRRIERDLHDGAQQRLVTLALKVRGMQAAMPADTGKLSDQLDDVVTELTGVLDDLREIASGLHPAVLAEGGLRPALKTLGRRSALPVRLDIDVNERLPEPIEVAAYYLVAEALTNATKHAQATVVDVHASADDGVLRLNIRDDGHGGADPSCGSGLVGLIDRIEALGGHIELHSPPGAGTTIQATLPLVAPDGLGVSTSGTGHLRPSAGGTESE